MLRLFSLSGLFSKVSRVNRRAIGALWVLLLGACLSVIGIAQASTLQKKEWWVQLSVSTDESGGMVDDNNYLGWLVESDDGKDRSDLLEIPPFSSPYLTLVFPRDDWGADSGEYGSDFRSVKRLRRKNVDEWLFEVRTDQPGREVTLSWTGDGLGANGKKFRRMRLIDLESGKEIKAYRRKEIQTYTVELAGTIHRFKWVRR